MPIRHWNYLRTMSALVRTGTYRTAGQELGISNTTVSRHIEQLEHELGSQIFVLKNGYWVLTEVGAKLEKVSKELQVSLATVANEAKGRAEFAGEVSITTVSFIENFFLSQNTKIWAERNPKATLAISATDRNDAVEHGHSDIGLRLSRPEKIGLKRLKLVDSPVGFFAPHQHSGDHWIGLSAELSHLPEMKMAHARFGKGPSIRLDSYPAIAKASLNTGLPGILPTCISPYFQGLRRIKSDMVDSQVVRELWVVFHEKRSADVGIRSTIDWLQTVFPSSHKCLCGMCDY